MARNDMISNHKRGLVNSTVGNGFRGMAGGALAFGGIAAIATIATGGLALPLVLGAAAVGGAVVGGMNAIGGGIRWGLETIGGIIGINRKQSNNMQMDDGYGPEQQQKGMGMAEGLVALVGAAMGMQSMKNKISNAFGSNDKDMQQGQNFDQQEAQYNMPGGRPTPNALLADKASYNEKGDIEFRLTREDMANPAMRDAVRDFGRAQASYRDTMMSSKDLGSKREAVEMQRTARFVDENGVRDPSKMPGFDKDSGTYILRPEHMMNESVQHQMSSEGKAHQKEVERTARQEVRAVQSEFRDLTRQPVIQRVENPFVDPAQQQTAAAPAPQQQPAPEQPVAQQSAPQQPAAPVLAAPAEGRHKAAPESMGLMDAAREAAQGAKDSGVVHKGEATRAQAGSNAAKPEGPAAQTR